jgi:hypothetical protein
MFMRWTMRVLVVANRTAATPWLLQEIEQRAEDRDCEFALLVPDVDGRQPDWTLDVALSVIEQAAGRRRVRTVECDHDRDAFATVRRVLREERFDEVLVSVRRVRGPRWLRPDLIRAIERLDVPVTVIGLEKRALVDHTVLNVRWD